MHGRSEREDPQTSRVRFWTATFRLLQCPDVVGVQIGLRVREQRIKHKVRWLEVEGAPDFQMSACQCGLISLADSERLAD